MILMPTFIDESGDTGHAQSSSSHFRLAALWIPSLDEAAFRESFRQLSSTRPDLHLEADQEYKFATTASRPDIREAFFHLALRHEFVFAFCSIDKTRGYWRSAPSSEQHWATATDLAVSLRNTYHTAEALHPERLLREPIFVDDNRDQDFLEAINRAFRGLRSILHPGVAMVRNPRFRGSSSDELIQLVDMVCGAAGAWIDGETRWHDLLRSRCVGMTEL
jgi:Protein of unknown function (DUF3800)